jgi:hypothetical protein
VAGRSLGLLLVLTSMCAACDGPVNEPDAGGGVDAGELADCSDDLDCDDGTFCNGEEQCVEGACRSGPAMDCDDGVVCTMDVCSESRRTCDHLPPDRDDDGALDVLCGGDDCADNDANRFPGNAEVCDAAAHDEDCAPETFGFSDVDRDGHHDAGCCNYDETGAAFCGDDCDDANPNAHPTATEACDGFDNDCDGLEDEGLTVTLYRDADGDLHGTVNVPMVGCPGLTLGYSASSSDCDDGDASIHVGAAETCNERDDDCDTMIDDGCFGCPPSTPDDMWVACTSTRCANTSRWVSDCGGCDRACTNAHGDVSCVAGACDPICASGWDDCNGIARDGCETDIVSDDLNCGACGNVCARGETCDRARCLTCRDAELVDCAGECIPSDVQNCGICRTVCPGSDAVCLDLNCVRCSVLLPSGPPEGWCSASDPRAGELRCPNMVAGQLARVTGAGYALTNDPGNVSGRYVYFDLVVNGAIVASYRGAGSSFVLSAVVTVPASGEIEAYFQYVDAGWSGGGGGHPVVFQSPVTITIEDLP